MWSYSGPKNESRISEEEVPNEIFEKQVLSLTKLMKRNEIPPCLVKPFDSTNPLLKV
jgi:hypothetical protein